MVLLLRGAEVGGVLGGGAVVLGACGCVSFRCCRLVAGFVFWALGLWLFLFSGRWACGCLCFCGVEGAAAHTYRCF